MLCNAQSQYFLDIQIECVVKIIGLRLQYFTAGWNVFDFVLVFVLTKAVYVHIVLQGYLVLDLDLKSMFHSNSLSTLL